VALEHTRAIASRALGELHAAASAAHNTPFGDIVDTEDDLQPLMALAFRDATRATSLLAVTMAAAEFNVPKMRARAAEGWASVTELADVLAREHGVPFVIAHEIVSRFVRTTPDLNVTGVGERLTEAARECGRHIHYTDEALRALLSPEHFVAVRRTLGGPAAEVVGAALVRSRDILSEDEREITSLRDALADATRQRRAAVEKL
jgi:argininosuccinate lyase